MSIPVAAGPTPAPEVMRIVVANAERGTVLQLAVRGILAVFVVGTLVLLPPPVGAAACMVIAGAYVLAVIGLTVWLVNGGATALRWGWLGLYLDLLALSALCLVADNSAELSWTSFVLLGGFFLLPVMAATQVSWQVCAGVVVPTVVFYAVEAVLTREANDEPWASVALRVVVLAGVGAAAIGLTLIQRSRVLAIQELVADRTHLLSELMSVTESERRTMAEELHDGALQYILAARMDLEDAQDQADPKAFDRLDQALTQSSRMLRATVSELHPAVLAQSGLAAAVQSLATTAAERAKLQLTLEVDGWPAGTRTANDLLLFGTARELLANVVKHARATRLLVRLALTGGSATLTVADDGVGVDEAEMTRKLSAGHIGLDSQRVRVESAGGTFRISGRSPLLRGTAESVEGSGATVTVAVPVATIT